MTEQVPKKPFGWICLAYATRRKDGGGILQAKQILLESEHNFPREYHFPYNLACYCSQLHEFEEAEVWFKKAMAIDEKTVKRIAIDDPDLQPLWDSMSGTLWKRNA